MRSAQVCSSDGSSHLGAGFGWLAAAAVLALVGPLGCEESKPTHTKPSAPSQDTQRAKASAPVHTTQKTTTVKALRRPKDRSELILTDRRRAALEKAFPEATAFLDLLELEQALFKRNLTRGKVDQAVAAFDRLATGKWLLLVGNIGKQERDRFELAVRYTSRDSKDPFGLTANWFPLIIQAAEGYKKDDYRAGELVAILAKYSGKQQVTEAKDVVMLEKWDFTPSSRATGEK